MVFRDVVTGTTVLLFTALAGCTDLKPLQMDIDGLKGQVSKLQSEAAATRASADAASRSASAAAKAASGAQSWPTRRWQPRRPPRRRLMQPMRRSIACSSDRFQNRQLNGLTC